MDAKSHGLAIMQSCTCQKCGTVRHRSRRQVSLKQVGMAKRWTGNLARILAKADLSSGTGRQSRRLGTRRSQAPREVPRGANPAVNALDAQIYTKAQWHVICSHFKSASCVLGSQAHGSPRCTGSRGRRRKAIPWFNLSATFQALKAVRVPPPSQKLEWQRVGCKVPLALHFCRSAPQNLPAGSRVPDPEVVPLHGCMCSQFLSPSVFYLPKKLSVILHCSRKRRLRARAFRPSNCSCYCHCDCDSQCYYDSHCHRPRLSLLALSCLLLTALLLSF